MLPERNTTRTGGASHRHFLPTFPVYPGLNISRHARHHLQLQPETIPSVMPGLTGHLRQSGCIFCGLCFGALVLACARRKMLAQSNTTRA
jgi:hypothetical protein